MKLLLARTLGACVMACWALACAAADSNVLTLREALELAATRNPELAAFQSQATVVREQAAIQALSPSAVVELQLENFAGGGELSGTQALESTLQLSRVVELGGKARARRQVGDFELDHLTVEQRARQSDVFAEVARRFVHVLADQEQLKAARRTVALVEDAGKAVRSRVEAGAASPVQSSRAEIALARAVIAAEHAEHELQSSRVSLSTLWGEQAPQFRETSGALFGLGTLEPFEHYAQRLDANPELLTFASGQRVLEARTRLAEAQRQPNLTFNLGVRRFEALDDSALVAGVVLPLGVSRRAAMEIRSVQAERASLTFAQQSRRLELHSTLFGIYQELTHAQNEARTLQQQIRPQAQEMLRTTQNGYRAGRFSFLELADAQRQLLEVELEAIQAAARFHNQLIEIESLIGSPVATLVEGESK